jgi:hypothetical protein
MGVLVVVIVKVAGIRGRVRELDGERRQRRRCGGGKGEEVGELKVGRKERAACRRKINDAGGELEGVSTRRCHDLALENCLPELQHVEIGKLQP